MDVGDFENLKTPVFVSFWRTSAERGVRHRCPLLSEELGVSLATFAVDQLHCLNLGVLKEYVTTVFWTLLDNNIYGIDNRAPASERHALGILRLRHDLFAWYDKRKKEFPDESIYRMQNLTVKMLGTRKSPSLRAKAAETKFLLFFAVGMARAHRGSLPQGQALAGAGEALQKYMETCANHGKRLPPSIIQDTILRL